MVNVFVIRHATTGDTGVRLSGRAPGIHLNSRGVEQAEALGSAFRRMDVTCVYSSPLERAMDTAAAIAARRQPIEVFPLLNEIDFGEWTGRNFVDLHRSPAWTLFNTEPERAQIPGGESLSAVAERGALALETLAVRHRGNVVIVSHGDVIRLTLARLLGMRLNAFRRLTIEPASISYIRLGEGEPIVRSLNQQPNGAVWKEESV